MSGKGNCYDNSAVKTFFITIESEMIWRRSWQTRRAAETAIFQYINSFLQSAQTVTWIGLEKPRRLRTETRLNEHVERRKNGTGPLPILGE